MSEGTAAKPFHVIIIKISTSKPAVQQLGKKSAETYILIGLTERATDTRKCDWTFCPFSIKTVSQ